MAILLVAIGLSSKPQLRAVAKGVVLTGLCKIPTELRISVNWYVSAFTLWLCRWNHSRPSPAYSRPVALYSAESRLTFLPIATALPQSSDVKSPRTFGLEDVLEVTIWSPWPRRSSFWPWHRSLHVLENALSSARGQRYFLTCWKWAKVMTNTVSRWKAPESLRKSFWRLLFSWRTLEIFEKVLSEELYFLWLTPEFFGKFMKFWAKIFVFRSLPRCVLGLEHSCPWPLEGLSFALPLDFFVCLASSLVSSIPPLTITKIVKA